MNDPNYELKRDYFRLAHLSKAAIIFVLILFSGMGLLLIFETSQFLKELGIALVPVGLVGLAYELFIRQEFLNEVKLELSNSLSTYFEQFDRLRRAGVSDVYDSFPTTTIAERFESADSIRILQTWIPDIITLINPIMKSLQRGGRARILLLHPDSALSIYRAKSLQYVDGEMASMNIRSNLAEIARAARAIKVEDQLEVRLYDALPIACVHGYGDEAVIGFFWQGIPAISAPQLLISRSDSKMMTIVTGHFENLWRVSIPYPLNGTPEKAATEA
jgi:hypothetical protein